MTILLQGRTLFLYTVLHEVQDPRARVPLVGPFTLERHTSYRAWVQWARYLAARRIEVLRYDLRVMERRC